MTDYSVVYIDESEKDRKLYSDTLNETGLLSVHPLTPPRNVDSQLSAEFDRSLALIDYVLDEKQADDSFIPYKGSLLGAAIRSQFPTRPVVLFTQKTYEDEDLLGVHDLSTAYDSILFKKDVLHDPKKAAEFLRSLIEGFRVLEEFQATGTWRDMLEALKADEASEGPVLRQAHPPGLGTNRWRVPEAARWIRGTIIEYPGILYDSLHASAALGISETSFLNELKGYLNESRFTGVFVSPDSPRWWKQRLLQIANCLMDSAGTKGSVPSQFSRAFELIEGIRLQPSICLVSGQEHADCICHILRKPVMRRYSLPIIPDDRPSVMETARLSFKAIREENFDERWFREDAVSLVQSIRQGD